MVLYTKKELCNVCNCTWYILRTKILTDKVIESLGFSATDFKRRKTFTATESAAIHEWLQKTLPKKSK